MSKIKFIASDFSRLINIRNLNKISYNEKLGEYKSERQASIIEKEINKVQFKMKQILKKLEEFKFLDDFTYDICQNRQISNQYKKGKYRNHSWLYIYENSLFEYFRQKYKIKKYVHYYLPQIQISINEESFTTASIWFEPSALKTWKEQLINYLTQSPINDKSIHFTVYEGKNEIFKHYDDSATPELTQEFIKVISSKSGIKAGICLSYEKEFVINKDIIPFIRKDIPYLFNEYYKPIFNHIITNKSGQKKLKKGFKNRTRKESSEITIRKIFRKGTIGGVVSQEHEKMKKGYKHFLEHLHNVRVLPEKNYVDLTLKLKDRFVLYEIKTDEQPHKCIRNGLGQLLFYAWQLKETTKKNIEINIVGKTMIDSDISEFIDYVKEKIGISFGYIGFDYKTYNQKFNIK